MGTITRPPLSPNAQHMTADGKPTKDFYNWLKQATSSFITADDTASLTNKTFADSSDILGIVKMTLGSDGTGDIWYRNSSGLLTRLGIGSTGNVLTVAGGLPSWAAPTPSGITYLGSVTAASNVIADTTIIAANNSAYRGFSLRFRNVIASAGSICGLQVHSGGSFQATGYSGQYGDASGASNTAGTETTCVPIGASATAQPGLWGAIETSNLSDTSEPKMWWGLSAGLDSSMNVLNVGGYWSGGNGAIDGFQIIALPTNNITNGTVDIYGIQ